MGSPVGRSDPSPHLQDLLDWLRRAPAGTTLDASAIRDLLERATPAAAEPPPTTLPIEPTWRERLWTAPAETRIGVRELAEAVGRPRSWVYRRTGPNSPRAPLPHRKLDGELVFVVGEIRDWLRDHESGLAPVLQPDSAGRR